MVLQQKHRVRTHNTKVAILGKLPGKFNAPFQDPSWDIWGFNIHPDMPPRYSLWFDIHPKTDVYDPLKKYSFGIIKHEDFPFEECLELTHGLKIFNNTVSWLIAYAILNDYKEIALYGMRFDNDHEHRYSQKQCVNDMLLFAIGRGIKVIVPKDVFLREYPLYAYSEKD